jgi:peptidoglycan-N-acetylglucosamine deacetylase
VDPLDWKRPGASVVTQRILSQVRPGAIVLSHDIHKQTVDAMPATLDGLIAKGYKFVTVSQLIAMNKPKPPSAETTGDEKSHSTKNRKNNPAPVKTENAPVSSATPTPTPGGGSQ